MSNCKACGTDVPEFTAVRGVKSVAFNKTGLRVYSAGHDGNVCELDSLTGQHLSKFRAAKIPLSCVAVSPGQLGSVHFHWKDAVVYNL